MNPFCNVSIRRFVHDKLIVVPKSKPVEVVSIEERIAQLARFASDQAIAIQGPGSHNASFGRLEPAAKTAHVNFSKLASLIKAHFLNGRLFASTRIKKISAGSRMIYVMGAPLIPFVRLWYIFRNASQPGRFKGQFFKVLPVILLGLLMDGLGQFAGYVFGEGDTSKSLLCYEFHRNQHLAKKESNIAP